MEILNSIITSNTTTVLYLNLKRGECVEISVLLDLRSFFVSPVLCSGLPNHAV